MNSLFIVREESWSVFTGREGERGALGNLSTPLGGESKQMSRERLPPDAKKDGGAATDPSSAATARGEARRILIVEDDPATLETIANVLEAEGYEVSTATDGRAALDQLNQTIAPDVILLDLRMPVMDGWSFRIAQRRSSTLAPIPVIAMSADGTSPAAAISADAFLKKPLDMPELLGTIERVVAESEHRRHAEHWSMVERMASLGQVAAGVGHEINNPLAFVLMNVTLVRDELRDVLSAQVASPSSANAGIASADVRQLAGRLDESLIGLERIRGIVQNLQRLSKKPDQEREPLHLERILDESITLARSHLYRARLTKRYQEVPLVVGSAGALGQVFLNLLINAAQALPDGDAKAGEISVTIGFDGVDVSVASHGYGSRHCARAPSAHLRSVLHDQGWRARHRARAGDLQANRHGPWRHPDRRERDRAWNGLPHILQAGPGGRLRVTSDPGRHARDGGLLAAWSNPRDRR